MLYFDGLGGLIMLGLWIFCFIDVLVTPDGSARNLPKLAWVFIVLVLPDIGSIAWLVAGHPWNKAANKAGTANRGRSSMRLPDFGRQNRYVPTNPDDDEEFLAGLRERAEEQRRRAREQQDNDRLDGDKT